MITREPETGFWRATLSVQHTEAPMNINLFPNLAASSLALALAANSASAQIVITRTIAAEPFETTVTQTPNGTVVTRRPVEAPAQGVAPAIVQPAVPAATVAETIPD